MGHSLKSDIILRIATSILQTTMNVMMMTFVTDERRCASTRTAASIAWQTWNVSVKQAISSKTVTNF